MIITTTNEVPGRTITQWLGLVCGISVRSPQVLQGLAGDLRLLVGGENAPWHAMCEQTRATALERMKAAARRLGANAVVAVRYDTTDLGGRVSEVFAFGTAVLLDKPVSAAAKQDPAENDAAQFLLDE